MEKLRMETADLTQKNIEKIGALFPNVITEMRDENGKLKKGINFEILKQELSGDVIDGEECFDFTWVGKKAAIVEGNTPIRKTLRPCIEESKDWENTENLYIEGDNLEVLKLLQESYLNSVKMIYIDPPYNTGNDFIYKDNFTMDKDEYDEQIGFLDEEENRLFKNTDTNGRFHSDWCSMMYPRLKLAHSLLSEDGVIFISIDDNEVENMKKMCHEIFGEVNLIALLPTVMNLKGNNDQFGFAGTHEYTLVYAKNREVIEFGFLPITNEQMKYWDKDDHGFYKRGASLKATGVNAPREKRPNLYFPLYITTDQLVRTERSRSTDIEIWPITDGREMSWRWSKEKFNSEPFNIILNKSDNNYSIYKKTRPLDGIRPSQKPKTLFYKPEYSSGNGTNELRNLFGGKIFSNPKPSSLIDDFIRVGIYPNTKGKIVLDFFAGSSTTAHSTMNLNAMENLGLKFIMVQLPEPCDEKSEAYKAGYKTICEIGKERIRRAGEKIKKENKDKENIDSLDIGFRVLKVDSTNMKDVYYSANDYNQDMLDSLESNIKEDRADLDLLYGVLLDWGLPLSLKHEMDEVDGVTVHTVDEGSLIACFDEKITEDVVREIAKRQPLRVVFRDSSFADSPDKINVEEIFKLLAPNTTVKVI